MILLQLRTLVDNFVIMEKIMKKK